MALFGNDNRKTIEELEDYYSNKSQRTGMAWAMAFLSLLITVAVLGGLFFGGRWLYRSINDDSTQPVATTANTDQVDANEDNSGSVIGNLGLSINDSQTQGVVSDEAASTDTPNTDSVSVTPEEETNTNENESESQLPDTGADSVLLITPLLAMVAGYYYSRSRQLKYYSDEV